MVGGKLLLLCGPSASGKSFIAESLCADSPKIKKLNYKQIAAKVFSEHEKKYFSEELQEASNIAGVHVPNLKVFDALCIASQNALLVSLQFKKKQKQERLGRIFFIELYKVFFDEIQKLFSRGFNCVIDHNIFLDPYPLRYRSFCVHFRTLGENFKILQVYSKIRDNLQNVLDRNKQFTNFVKKYSSYTEAILEISKLETQQGYTSIHYRQPIQIIKYWPLYYSLDNILKTDADLLEVVERSDLQSLCKQIQLAQDELMNFLIKHNPTANEALSIQKLESSRSSLLNDWEADSKVFIHNKRFIYDDLFINTKMSEDTLNSRQNFFTKFNQNVKEWLLH